jgi:hypothetical protein
MKLTSKMINTMCVIIALIFLIALINWPIFASIVCVALSILIGFLATERIDRFSYWHASIEWENRICTLFFFLFAVAWFLAPDSPAYRGPVVGVVLVGFITLGALMGYSHWRQSRLEMSSHIKRVNSTTFQHSALVIAKEKVRDLAESLNGLNYKFPPNKLFYTGKISALETRIYDIFQEATAEELNYFVSNKEVNLARILYKVKDRDIMQLKNLTNQPNVRTALLKLLASERVEELEINGKVAVLDAMQQMKLSANHLAEGLVCNIFLKTKGFALTILKDALDTKGTADNLHKLIYIDIRSPSIREQILNHFRDDAKEEPSLVPRRKILSDVDDTLFASGGEFPAGIDASFKKHQLYPGVLRFYKELDLGYSHHGIWDDSKQGNMVFLSARPHVVHDFSEKKSYGVFDNLRKQEQGLHAVPTLLAGDLKSGYDYIYKGDVEPMAQKKFINFDQYASLYPECRFVFIGDNGQGDVRAGALMAAKYTAQMEMVLIHQVQPIHKTPLYTPESPFVWDRANIQFFQTYIGAALRAARGDLIHPSGLRRVAAAAIKELRELSPSLSEKNNPNTVTSARPDQARRHAPSLSRDEAEARRVELNVDIEEANIFLATTMLDPIDPMLAECVFYSGALVRCPYGVGQVLSFEPRHNMYAVELDSWRLAQNTPVRCYVHASCLAFSPIAGVRGSQVVACPGDAVLTPHGTGILLELTDHGIHAVGLRCRQYMALTQEEEKKRLQQHWKKTSQMSRGHSSAPNADNTNANTSFNSLPNSKNTPGLHAHTHRHNDAISTQFLHDIGCHAVGYFHHSSIVAIEAALGDFVETPYGVGMVDGYRHVDRCFTVKLAWGTGFLDHTCVKVKRPDIKGSGRFYGFFSHLFGY